MSAEVFIVQRGRDGFAVESYRSIDGERALDEICRIAKRLRGVRAVTVNVPGGWSLDLLDRSLAFCECCGVLAGCSLFGYYSDERCNAHGIGVVLCLGCARKLARMSDAEFAAGKWRRA